MRRILLLSDTHGFLDDKITKYIPGCNEIWHAGDIGSLKITDQLAKHAPVRAVFGNIDGHDLRREFPEHLRFGCEDVKVYITHIGGFPDHYSPGIRNRLLSDPPDLFISGHSHILRVMYDKKLNFLHINPGAAGIHGFHHMRTMVRFTIDGKNIRDLEIIELGKRGELLADPVG